VDNVALEQFLSLELEYGLSLAVQAMVVSDVAGTSGFRPKRFPHRCCKRLGSH
jgi:hypothetical protein